MPLWELWPTPTRANPFGDGRRLVAEPPFGPFGANQWRPPNQKAGFSAGFLQRDFLWVQSKHSMPKAKGILTHNKRRCFAGIQLMVGCLLSL